MQILSANIGVQIKPVFHFQTMEIGQLLALKSECAKKSTVNNNCEKWKVKKKTNTEESGDGKKQNQSNERHLNLSPPSSIRKVLHDQIFMGFLNVMNLCNRIFLRAV